MIYIIEVKEKLTEEQLTAIMEEQPTTLSGVVVEMMVNPEYENRKELLVRFDGIGTCLSCEHYERGRCRLSKSEEKREPFYFCFEWN